MFIEDVGSLDLMRQRHNRKCDNTSVIKHRDPNQTNIVDCGCHMTIF